jgi:hypothetical protein
MFEKQADSAGEEYRQDDEGQVNTAAPESQEPAQQEGDSAPEVQADGAESSADPAGEPEVPPSAENQAVEYAPFPDEAKGVFLTFYNDLVSNGQIPPAAELPKCLR